MKRGGETSIEAGSELYMGSKALKSRPKLQEIIETQQGHQRQR